MVRMISGEDKRWKFRVQNHWVTVRENIQVLTVVYCICESEHRIPPGDYNRQKQNVIAVLDTKTC